MTQPRTGAVPGSPRPDETASGVSGLYRQWRQPMARLAYVLTSDAERSDEIVQDAFLKLHTNWDHVDNPVGYLRTTVVNGCRSHHRRRAVERRAPVDRPAVTSLAARELDDALAKLDHKYRVVLALKYFVDLSDDDIATMLGLRPASVRTRIHRALAKLRQEIEQ